ncbi:hypothetical protein BEH94_08250 [Candidatus Altiarchaeales archaeon WOR_SM1_SCG]|nr:hypothetical protein BEH94_08250 [Candidatus Altiarchaeales archaeon WOR_SM1_SCG]
MTNKIKIAAILCALLLLIVLLKFTWLCGFLLIFFIPGFALTLVLFRDIAVDERIGVAVILSISINILTIFAANYFLDIEITKHNITALMLLVSLLFLVLFLVFLYFRTQESFKIKNLINNFKVNRNDVLKSLLLISTLVLVFNLIYAAHWDYLYPYHTDEWENLAEAVAIMENHALLNKAPNCKDIKKKIDLEIGSHIFLAELFLLTGADPVTTYKYLPALFAAISAFMLFLVVKRYNFYAAILSMIFFASLKTNISIMGIWLFAPLTMSIAFIYAITFMFLYAIENKFASFLGASASLLALALIHPISAVFVYMILSLYIILKFIYYLFELLKKLLLGGDKKEMFFTWKNTTGFIILFLIPFISFIYFMAILSKGTTADTINWFITKFIIFPKSTGVSSLVYEPAYLPDIYGILGIGLAVIGILYIIYMRKKWKHSGFLIAAALTGIINLILFHFPGIGSSLLNLAAFPFRVFALNLTFNLPGNFAILIFYERFIYYTMVFIVPLSALGLYASASAVINACTFAINIAKIKILNKIHRHICILLCIAFTILVFTTVFSGYYDEKEKLYKMITDEDYEAIKWIEENKGRGHVILARTEVSMAVYSISRNYVVAGTSHEDNCPGENVKDIHRFFMGNCNERTAILKKHDVDYVITDFEIPCNLKEIYRNEKNYIYEVNMS